MPPRNPAERAPGRPKAHYHHGDLRTALIAAGAEMLEKTGSEGLSLRELARVVGVSRTAPYHHFVDKEGLLAAIAADAFHKMAADQAALRRAFADPLERLKAMGRFYVMLARERPQTIRLMVGRGVGANQPPAELLDAVNELLMFVREAVSEYLAGHGGKAQVELITVGAFSLVHGLSMLLNEQRVTPERAGLPDEAALIDGVMEIFVRGVEALASANRARGGEEPTI